MPNEAEAITIRFADDFEENLYALSKSDRADISPNEIRDIIAELNQGE
jgi:hypothetical protein